MTEKELCHAGVKGMKWGVRKDKTSGSGSRPASQKPHKTSNNVKKSPSKPNNSDWKISSKKRRLRKGTKVVAKKKGISVKILLGNTANVTAGALRLAACFVPGLDLLATGAAAATVVGTAANLKSVKQ